MGTADEICEKRRMRRPTKIRVAVFVAGFRLRDIERIFGVCRTTVNLWMLGALRPRPDRRQKLADLVGVPVAELWPDAPGR